MENIVLKASDGYALSLAVFEREHPRGYIQIIHGMEEHKERYEAFAEQLWQVGFTVVTSDMRGHGEHAPKLGFFKEKDGDRYLLSDQVQITAYIRERFQTEKVMIFAHSMGTIIARNLLCTQLRKGGTERIPELSGNTDYPHRVFPDKSAHKGAWTDVSFQAGAATVGGKFQ